MKRTVRQVGAPALAFTTVFALVQLAQAQEPAPAAPAPAAPAPAPAPEPAPAAAAGGSAQAQVGGGAQAQGGGAMTLPGAAPAAQAAPGDSDHDAVVGSLGIGYLGRRSMAVGCNGGLPCVPVPGAVSPVGDAFGTQQIGAPVIGIRYWIDQTIGIDAGLGMAIGGASLTNNAPAPGAPNGDVPQASFYAFIIHGGLPLALASSGHYSFQIIPEVNVGFAGWSQDRPVAAPPAPALQGFSGSGFHLDVGARAGAEIHFGFIGLPKLALQGSVGLLFSMDNTAIKDKDAAAATPAGAYESKGSQTGFQTTVQDNPWNIFTTNVAALYYF